MANVTFAGVGKSYPGGVQAVKDFNLEIRDREFVVFVGPSGCGKSTTLRMVAGLEEISQGTIRIGDRVVNDIPPKDRDVAMVFQNYALYPHMTVYKNLAFALKLRHVPKSEIDRRVRQAATILGLEDLLTRLPKALSGGQRQRVAMGRAIVREPQVFLFDEPLSNLDAKMRVEMRKEILHLHRRLNSTMIYVTHDQVEAMTLGDRVVVMKDGGIRQAADPLTVYRCPADAFVAQFIGTPPMNLLEGVLAKGDGGLTWNGQGLRAPLPADVSARLTAFVGQQVRLGIRPEDLVLRTHAGPNPAAVWSAQVDVCERLGSEILVHLSAGPHRLQVRASADDASLLTGNLETCPRLERVHVFHGQTGENLTASLRAG